jgi:hypothetical protein
MIPTKFWFISPSGARGEDFKKHTILVSGWLISKKSSYLKLLGQMNRNLIGNILGMSFRKIANLVPIHSQTWSPKAIFVSDWLIRNKNCLWQPCLLTDRNK